MTDSQIDSRTSPEPSSEVTHGDVVVAIRKARAMAGVADAPPGHDGPRRAALVKTKLDEAILWASAWEVL